MTLSTESPAPKNAMRWGALSVLLLATAMQLFDATIVPLTLSSISEGLGASATTLSWVIAGYLLGYGLSLVPAGRVGDRYGHKWVFIFGLIGYIATGVLVSFSVNEEMLIITRVLHGVAGGFLLATTAAMIQLLFHGVERVRAFGYFAATTGLGALVAPILGGWVLDATTLENGWRWAMLVELPVGVLALLLSIKLLPGLRGMATGKFDWIGMGLLAAVVIGVMTPLIDQLPSWTWASFCAAAVVLIVFIAWERRREARDEVPVMRMSLFRAPNYSFGLVMTVLGFASFTSSIYIAIYYVWFGRGEDAVAAALVMLPLGLGAIVGGLLDDRLTVMFKRWDNTVALLLNVIGYGSTLVILYTTPLGASTALYLVVPLFVAGLGNGSFIGLNMASVLSAVPSRDAGSAGGLIGMAQRLGAALGAAIIGVIIAIPTAEGAIEEQAWIDNGVLGVLACTIMLSLAAILGAIVAVVSRRSAADTLVKSDSEPVTSAS